MIRGEGAHRIDANRPYLVNATCGTNEVGCTEVRGELLQRHEIAIMLPMLNGELSLRTIYESQIIYAISGLASTGHPDWVSTPGCSQGQRDYCTSPC